MKIRYKAIFFLVSLILFLNSTSDIFGQRKSINKSKTFRAAQKTADERRKEVEALMLQGEYQHDGSGELLYIGTIDSVPALLKVLENNPPHIYQPCKDEVIIPPPPPLKGSSVPILTQQEVIPKKDCSPKKSYICTYVHAISALRKITGQNFIDFEEWKNWWDEYLKNNANTK